jgi:hypothetical protein
LLNNERDENLERSAPLCCLQIDSQPEGAPLQFPVTVLDFADGLVILEMKNPLEAINAKTLRGAGGSPAVCSVLIKSSAMPKKRASHKLPDSDFFHI